MFSDAIHLPNQSIPLCSDDDSVKCKTAPLDGIPNHFPRKGFLYRTPTEFDRKDRNYFNLKYCDPETQYRYDGDDPYYYDGINCKLSNSKPSNSKPSNNTLLNNTSLNSKINNKSYLFAILIFLVFFLIWLVF